MFFQGGAGGGVSYALMTPTWLNPPPVLAVFLRDTQFKRMSEGGMGVRRAGKPCHGTFSKKKYP